MTAMFGATTAADDVLDGADLRGWRVLVTGVSAGVGVETAAFWPRTARWWWAPRATLRKEAATEQVRADAAHGGGIELIALDLASLASVRARTDALFSAGERFDAIIANAGVMAAPEGRTVDGFETQFGTNHLGHTADTRPKACGQRPFIPARC